MKNTRLVTVALAGALMVACSGAPVEKESTPAESKSAESKSGENTFKVSQGVTGSNVLFDQAANGGQPLNYNNSGCLISFAYESMYGLDTATMPNGSGTFQATGNLDGCVAVCKGWTRSFTTSPGPYTWETKNLDVTWNESTGEAYYQCNVNYAPWNTGPKTCFPIGEPLKDKVPGDAEFVGWQSGRVCL